MRNQCTSLLGLWHNYKYANILPEEQLLREEGTLHALLLPVSKMSYSKTLGSASSLMQNIMRRITPGKNKAMPSDPSSSASLQQPPGSRGREQRIHGKFRVNTREECLAQPRKMIPVFRRLSETKTTESLISVESHPTGRSVEFIKLLLAGAELRVSTGKTAARGREGRSAAELSRKRNPTRSRLPLSLKAAP